MRFLLSLNLWGGILTADAAIKTLIGLGLSIGILWRGAVLVGRFSVRIGKVLKRAENLLGTGEAGEVTWATRVEKTMADVREIIGENGGHTLFQRLDGIDETLAAQDVAIAELQRRLPKTHREKHP